MTYSGALNKENSENAKHTVSFSFDSSKEVKPKVEITGFGIPKINDKTGLIITKMVLKQNL